MTAFSPISKAFLLSNQSLIGDTLLPPGQGIFLDLATLNVVAGPSSIGYYDGSLSALGLGAGLILTSGTMPGTANTVTYFGQNNGMAGDPMLDAVVNAVFPTVSLDATTLSVDFTVTDPTITSISFNIVFGSDEYPEWVNQFVDIAAIWVNGQNYAYFNNDPHAPLSVIGSNLAANYFIDNTANLTNPAGFGGSAIPGVTSLLPIEYDGVSAPLTVTAPVHLGVNTLKIGIADTRDHIFDSGIIISNMRGGTVPYTGITRDVDGSEVNDDLEGSETPETLQGKGGDDAIYARGGHDVVQAGDGDDYIVGGTGNDYVQGGLGTDTANYSGLSTDYTIVANADGSYTVTDNRAGASDGEDTLVGVENIQFADVTLNLATGEAIAQVLAPVAEVAPPPPPPVAPPPALLPAAIDAVLVSTTEDAEPAEAGAFANVLVLDDSTLSVVDLPATMPAGVTFNSTNHAFYLDTGDAAYQSLAAGETATVTVQYGVSNGVATSPASVVFTVTGTNDASTVSGTVSAAVTEGGASASVNALANAADVDNGAVVSVVALPVVAAPAPTTNGNGSGGHGADDGAAPAPGPVGATVGYGLNTLPAGVSFDALTNTFSIDPANAAFAYLSLGQTANVVVNYGVTDGTAVTAASVTFTVTGTNSAPVVSGPAIVNALEGSGGAAMGRTALLAHVTDVDANDTLDLVISEADLPEGVVYNHTPGAVIVTNIPAFSYYGYNIPGGVFVTTVLPTDTLTLDTSNATFDHLAEGQSLDFVVGYSVSDGHISTPAQAIFHLTGVNDAPVVTSPVAGAATEGGDTATIDALANASDVDDGTTLIVCALPPVDEEAENVFNAAGVIEKALPPPPPILPFDPATLPAGVSYDAATHSFSLDAKNPAFGNLAAGQTRTVTVNYGVSDGIVITSATAVFTVTGTNNAPVVLSDPAAAIVAFEDGGSGTLNRAALLANVYDADTSDTLSILIDDTSLPAGVVYHHVPGSTTVSTITYYGFTQIITVPTVDTLTIDTSNAAYQSLAEGEVLDVAVNYSVSDGIFSADAKAVFHVTGTNDAPVVTGIATGNAIEGGAIATIDAIANATDIDHGAVLTVVAAPPPGSDEVENFLNANGVLEGAPPPPPPILPFDPATLPAGVTFDAATNSFSLDPSAAAYRYLSAGQIGHVAVQYGVSDGHVATAATAMFTIVGTNSGPVVSGPVGVTVCEDGATAGFKSTVSLGLAAEPEGNVQPPLLSMVDMTANASDIDGLDVLSVADVPAVLPAGVYTTHTAGGYTRSLRKPGVSVSR